jgi:hypothetical protein
LAEHPARLFVCARCRAQVLLCSRCDRGQRYCGRDCSRAARQGSRREAAQRYQRSRAGRLAHAQRSLVPIVARCQRCAMALSPWTRQGFLRHGRVSRWPARVVEPSP